MPFLFIDYDQGAGGEFFGVNLSLSDQCVTLESKQIGTGRTKTYDKFNQEFLNEFPDPSICSSHKNLYDIVLTHRHCDLGKQLLGDIKSIRISTPADEVLKSYINYQRLRKVLLSKLPGRIFVGEIRQLARDSVNQNFLKEINSNMDSLDLILLAKNIKPSAENRQEYLENIKDIDVPEPNFNYDLVISYSDLFFNADKIKRDISDVFGIEINHAWLDTYRKDYDAWLATT